MQTIQSVLLLAYPRVGEQDLLAPWELFRALAWDMGQRGEKLEVVLGSLEEGPVTAQMGLAIQAQKITSAHRFDLVYVPGWDRRRSAVKELDAPGIPSRAQPGRPVDSGELRRVSCSAPGRCAGPKRGHVARNARTPSCELGNKGAQFSTGMEDRSRSEDLYRRRRAGTVHPSTISPVWHLFGDAKSRGLAAGWDASPLFGEALFSRLGPVMKDVKSELQDTWEQVFLPE